MKTNNYALVSIGRQGDVEVFVEDDVIKRTFGKHTVSFKPTKAIFRHVKVTTLVEPRFIQANTLSKDVEIPVS
jgi:hypothetical protein